MAWAGAGFLAILISCIMTQYKISITGVTGESAAETFYNNLIAIPTFAVFYCARWFFSCRNVSTAVQKVIIFFGRSAFGIMLCEHALRIQLEPLYYYIKPIMPRMLSCLIWVAVIYLTGLFITAVMKLIPGIKRLI